MITEHRNPLRKQYITTRPTPAYPCLTAEEDRELDIAVQRIIHVEITTRRMYKEMKKYINAIKQVDSTDQALTSNLVQSGLVHVNDNLRILMEEFHSITTQIGKTVEEAVIFYQKSFLEPLKKLREHFAYIRDALNKREDLVSTWKTAHTNFKKYNDRREKKASDHVKLNKEKIAEEQAGKELKAYHAHLLTELPIFLEKRLEYMKPTLHAFIATQLEYYGNSTRLFTQLMPEKNESGSPNSSMSEEDYQREIDTNFKRIKELTIVKHC
uniref:BAR domain-containing protein n=1 Tax=Trichogramma kaykai TaxID=54128 RepID=A0ABD2W3R9_9HYME